MIVSRNEWLRRALWLGAASWIVLPEAALAATFFLNDPVADRDAFLASAGDVQLESFETPFDSATSIEFPVGGPIAVSISSNFELSQFTHSGGIEERAISDGMSGLAVDEHRAPVVTLSFGRPVISFGLNVNDLNFASMSYSDDAGNSLQDALLSDDGGPDGGLGFENRQFIGVVSQAPVTTVTLSFSDTNSTGTIVLDRLYYRVIPEPASGSLAMLLAQLLASRTRKRTG